MKRKIRFLPPVKRYVNAIESKLALPFREKVRVMTDLSTAIEARHEAGESYEEIMKKMGTPEEVAAQFNEEMAPNARARSPLRFIPLILAVFAFLPALVQAISGIALTQFFASNASIGIIGGADGPTTIFIESKAPAGGFAGLLSDVLTFSPAALIVALLGWYFLLARKPKASCVCGVLGILFWIFPMLVISFGPLAAAGSVTAALRFLLAPSLWLSLILLVMCFKTGKR